MEGRKLNKHRPFHIYDGHTYFVTGRCYNGIDYFKENSKKEMFRKILKDSIEKFNIKLFSWVLLNNHYHVMFTVQALDEFHSVQFVTPKVNEWNDEMSESEFRYTLQKKKIVEFVRKLHKDTARILNKQNNTQGRKIWYQYFDYCIRNKTVRIITLPTLALRPNCFVNKTKMPIIPALTTEALAPAKITKTKIPKTISQKAFLRGI